MTLPMDTVITLAATAAGFAFLIGCAWHNRRSGYRKIRPAESPVHEALLWLSALNGSPACEEVPVPLTSASAASATITGVDLLALETALGRQESPVLATERTPEPVLADVSREETGNTLRTT
ncbi:MAG: hypothetical protein ABJC09_15160 [Terriglobia bacterium]